MRIFRSLAETLLDPACAEICRRQLALNVEHAPVKSLKCQVVVRYLASG